MSDYSKGKIYMIKSLINEDSYIGSTILTLQRRNKKHISDSNCDRNYYCESHKIVLDKHTIILLENYPCNTNKELLQREQYWMNLFPKCINRQRAVRTEEQKKEYQKQYRKIHSEKCNNRRKELRHYVSSWGYNKYLGTDLNLLDISLDIFH